MESIARAFRARRQLRRVALVSCAAFLAACAGVPPGEDDQRAAWARHQRWLETLDDWRVAGRVAVSAKTEGWSASMRWRQEPARFRIQLNGPFGQGAVRINGGEKGVELRSADGRIARAATPESLVASELGVAVPISALRYWLTGRPAPGADATALTLDWAGRVEELEQLGWTVRYQEYTDGAGGDLPARLEVRRDAVHARFVLSGWQLTP